MTVSPWIAKILIAAGAQPAPAQGTGTAQAGPSASAGPVVWT